MQKSRLYLVLLTAIALLLQACAIGRASNLTIDDFSLLKKGMTATQAVQILGNPHLRSEKSPAFLIYSYQLKTGERVNLGFLAKADYLDSIYLFNDNGESKETLLPSSQQFPSGLLRDLTLSDFEGLSAGDQYFFDVYYQIGPPSMSGLFEGGHMSLVYFLSDGARVSMQTFGGYGCISEIGFSPKSFGADWTTLSEDTQGLCAEK